MSSLSSRPESWCPSVPGLPPSQPLALPLEERPQPPAIAGGCGSSTPAAATAPASLQGSCGLLCAMPQAALLLLPEGSTVRRSPSSREQKGSSASSLPLLLAVLPPPPLQLPGSSRMATTWAAWRMLPQCTTGM